MFIELKSPQLHLNIFHFRSSFSPSQRVDVFQLKTIDSSLEYRPNMDHQQIRSIPITNPNIIHINAIEQHIFLGLCPRPATVTDHISRTCPKHSSHHPLIISKINKPIQPDVASISPGTIPSIHALQSSCKRFPSQEKIHRLEELNSEGRKNGANMKSTTPPPLLTCAMWNCIPNSDFVLFGSVVKRGKKERTKEKKRCR